MTNKVLPEGHLTFGEGNISGYIACLLAILSFLGVLAFHFPQYLTTPELRQAYDVDLLRQVMFVSLVISGSLGLLNFIRNRRKRLGLVAWGFIAVTIALGGVGSKFRTGSRVSITWGWTGLFSICWDLR